jgi:hypothetical protein
MAQNTDFTQEDEARIRKQIEKRYEDRQGLIIHASIFILINVALWIIQLLTLPEFPFALIITAGWGSGMVAHYLSYYYKYGGGAEKREAAIQREIESYRERHYAYEKPKHDEHSHLEWNDDAEIEEIYQEDTSAGRKRR